jgi:hypothetical protein
MKPLGKHSKTEEKTRNKNGFCPLLEPKMTLNLAYDCKFRNSRQLLPLRHILMYISQYNIQAGGERSSKNRHKFKWLYLWAKTDVLVCAIRLQLKAAASLWNRHHEILFFLLILLYSHIDSSQLFFYVHNFFFVHFNVSWLLLGNCLLMLLCSEPSCLVEIIINRHIQTWKKKHEKLSLNFYAFNNLWHISSILSIIQSFFFKEKKRKREELCFVASNE